MGKQCAVILHGGAGRFDNAHAHLKLPILRQALDSAWSILVHGGNGMQAVVAALTILEGSQYFNAGFGGYPNNKGVVLLDVGLMNGKREFISLINVRRVKYPSIVALDMFPRHASVMTTWTHELMQALDNSPEENRRRYGWVETNDELVAPFVREVVYNRSAEVEADNKHGTVGCVVRDGDGKLYAGTSTGGVSLKANGRVGDSPIIAGGVFADDEICALSTTGHGEAFMASMVSGFVIAEIRRRLRSDPLAFERNPDALKSLLDEEFSEFGRKSPGKNGALIAIPPAGPPAFTFNSEKVSLALRTGNGEKVEHEEVMVACREGHRITGSPS